MIARLAVIARSASNEAIHLSPSGDMDCFAEACHRARIRATRWLAMTWMEWSVNLPHHRRGLPEQHPALFLGAVDRLAEIRVDLLGQRVGALGRGPGTDGFQPALQMREVV